MRYLHNPIKLLDLIEGINTGRKTTVKAENAVFNNGRKGQVVEERCEVLPHIGISILSKALIVESINLGDLLGLVISTKNGDTIWVSYLKADKERDRLN